jgi:hypothetical protein
LVNSGSFCREALLVAMEFRPRDKWLLLGSLRREPFFARDAAWFSGP